MDYLAISNLPIFWALAGITVVVSAVQTILYVRQANKATVACNLDPQLPKQAFKIGLISAIGPACGVFIVMVGLMAPRPPSCPPPPWAPPPPGSPWGARAIP